MSEQRITIEQIRQWAHAQDHTWDVPLLVAALRRHKAWKAGGAWCVDGDAWTYLLGVVDMAAIKRWEALIKEAGFEHLTLWDQEYDHKAQALLLSVGVSAHGCSMDLVLRVDDARPGLRLVSADIIDQVASILTSPMSNAILARMIRAASTKPGVTLEVKL